MPYSRNQLRKDTTIEDMMDRIQLAVDIGMPGPDEKEIKQKCLGLHELNT